MDWYYSITSDMIALGLKGNDLLVFAVIHTFTQNGWGRYIGSLDTLAAKCNVARSTAVECLKRLTEAGLIKKTETFENGVKFCAYRSVAEFGRGVRNSDGGSPEIGPNNKEENKDRFINKPSLSNAHARESKKSAFVAPSLEEVREYCAARGSKIDPEAFVAFYTSKGWKIGSAPMKDWRAAVITWEKREAQHPTSPNPSAPRRKESYVESAYRTYDALFGTDYHKKKYGND